MQFHIISAWRDCIYPRVYTTHKFSLLEKFTYMAIYLEINQDILSRKILHKDTPISVMFFTFLLRKFIKSVDPQGNT